MADELSKLIEDFWYQQQSRNRTADQNQYHHRKIATGSQASKEDRNKLASSLREIASHDQAHAVKLGSNSGHRITREQSQLTHNLATRIEQGEITENNELQREMTGLLSKQTDASSLLSTKLSENMARERGEPEKKEVDCSQGSTAVAVPDSTWRLSANENCSADK